MLLQQYTGEKKKKKALFQKAVIPRQPAVSKAKLFWSLSLMGWYTGWALIPLSIRETEHFPPNATGPLLMTANSPVG